MKAVSSSPLNTVMKVNGENIVGGENLVNGEDLVNDENLVNGENLVFGENLLNGENLVRILEYDEIFYLVVLSSHLVKKLR